VAGGGAGRAGGAGQVYAALYRAIQQRRPIAAIYHERPRLFCPHRLGRNRKGELRVLCYQYGGESESGLGPSGSSDNWRCIAVAVLSEIKLLDGGWQTAANHSRPASCVADADIDAEDYPDRDPQ
jgi:hypothetical protein